MDECPNSFEQLRSVRVGVRPELEVSRHVFAGEAAYVIGDPTSFQSHRLSREDYQVFSAITSRQTLETTFNGLVASRILTAEQEEAFYRFIVSLTQLGLLNLPLSQGNRIYARYEERLKGKRKSKLMSLLFMQVPLFDPDMLLRRTVGVVGLLFSRLAVALWGLGLLASLIVVLSRWDEFTVPVESLLSTESVPILWALLVGLKLVHEFGHAYACKHFGGVVPEMGAYFILFTPCAYVDASASWGFTSRWHRIFVALAGMYFESIAAMCALLVWVVTPPGRVHDAAQYAVVLSTVVTVAFNSNPLMRYDGYYILSDLVGVPNLRSEADRSLRRALKRALFGIRSDSRAHSIYRQLGLVIFGLLGAAYKVTVVIGMCIVIAFKLPMIGVGMAILYGVQSVWRGGLSLVNYLRFSVELDQNRTRACCVSAVAVMISMAVVTAAPIPGGIHSIGIVAPMSELTIRADSPGFVVETLVKNGEFVENGTGICILENLDIDSNTQRLGWQARSLDIAWKRDFFDGTRSGTAAKAQLENLKVKLHAAQDERSALRIRADCRGVVTEVYADRPGEFVRKGEPIVTIQSGRWTIRTLLTAEQVAHARLQRDSEVSFRFTGSPSKTHRGNVLKVSPHGTKEVEKLALTERGGGQIHIDPYTKEAQAPLFEVTIGIADPSRHDVTTGSTAQIYLAREPVTLLGYLCRRSLQLLHDLSTI